MLPCSFRYCEEKFISKYIPTIGVDYGVKPVHFTEHEVSQHSNPVRLTCCTPHVLQQLQAA
jgi:hypothetical protein